MQNTESLSRYSVEAGHWQHEPVLILRDHQSGAEATICPGIGANPVAWAIRQGGQRVEVLETPPGPEELRSRKFKAGIPILWPFPGRVREAKYEFEGRQYHLPRTDKGGVHHIHGLVLVAPWQIVEYGPTAHGAEATLEITPDRLSEEDRAGYPFHFNLTVRYTLTENRLTAVFEVDNRGEFALPFGLGLHPYFQAPLRVSEETPDRTALQVHLPTATRWPAEEGLPTGPAQAVAPDEDFRQWRPLGPQPFDHMYSDVEYQGEYSSAGFRDPGAGLELKVRADRQFREWVLFTQPNRPSLCVEPYTCPPNAINFAAEGIPNAGLVGLEPGDNWQARVIYEVVEIS